jgi:hypothetical protein
MQSSRVRYGCQQPLDLAALTTAVTKSVVLNGSVSSIIVSDAGCLCIPAACTPQQAWASSLPGWRHMQSGVSVNMVLSDGNVTSVQHRSPLAWKLAEQHGVAHTGRLLSHM